MSRRFWTDIELQVLREFYPDSRTEDIARALGRSIAEITGAKRPG